jgi:hypothetical protein
LSFEFRATNLYPERNRSVAEKCGDMEEMTVESIFGVKAGIVWEALNQNGPSTIGDIVKATGLRRELVYGALGWLSREDKISVERRGRAIVFSLGP